MQRVFRPWTLLDNRLTTDTWPDVAADVPHLRNLGVVRETEDVREAKERVLETELDQSLAYMAAEATKNKRIRDFLLQKPSVVPERSDHFQKTWAQYIDGQVVSEHARQLIQNFLCNVAGREAGDESDQEEGDRSDVDDDIPRLDVRPNDLRQILSSIKLMAPAEEGEGDTEEKKKPG